MDFLDLMKERYTTKKYNPSLNIDKEAIEKLKQILRLTPASLNSQPWKFTFVSNRQTKEELALESMHNAERILDCDTVVVFSRIDDIAYFEEQIQRELPQRQLNYYNEYIKSLPESEIKHWFSRQLYISLGFFLSACMTMEIDSTPMEGIIPERYNEILGLEKFYTDFAVCIGYRAEGDPNQVHKTPKSRIDIDKIVQSI
jgi:nitroreductase/dihydropteridine reductase